MIPITPQPEPADFNDKVRVPGQRALAAGKHPLPPCWRECLDDLWAAYDGVCAYVCIYIHPVTGARSADHYVPKSSASEKAYEWSNYRLACSRMNSRKGTFDDVLDPFLVEDGWFSLNLVSFEVKPSANLDPALSNEVQVTIDRLGLNERDCRTARERDYEVHWQMHRDATCLRRLSPFVAREAERHGLLSDMAMSEHERGHRAGLCDALRYQIEHRFNRPLAREEALRIAGADDDQLRDWLQRVLTSESCEELFEQ